MQPALVAVLAGHDGMPRYLWLVLGLAACEPTLRMKPLPELVAQARPTPIAVSPLLLVPGETMIWDVNMGGFTIGRAELVVGEHDVQSRFTTGRLASTFAKVRHELTTVVEPGASLPERGTEVLEVDGETKRVAMAFDARMHMITTDRTIVVPDGNNGHTLHSALGVIRAWAQPEARAGYLYAIVGGDLFRIDLARPLVEELQGTMTLRIECRVRAEVPISMTIWLRASPDRTPLRIEISGDDAHLTAELIGS